MLKKIAGIWLFILLASSMVFANPFDESDVAAEGSVSDETLDTAKVVSDTEDKTDTEESKDTQETEEETATTEYTVVSGDYLSAIAAKLLGDSSRWPEIVELNKDKYPSLQSNPNLIYVGWVLTIPGSKGSKTSTSTSTSTSTDTSTDGSENVNTDETNGKDTNTSTSTASSTSTSTDTNTDGNKNTSSEGAIITADSRVLHIGDSHSCGVYGKTIDGLMRDTGATVNTTAVAGSNPSWFMNGTTGKCGYYSKDENGNVTEPYWQTPMKTPLLQNMIDTYKPSVLVVSLGANMVGYSESTQRSMVDSICDKAKAAGCKIVWVGPPDSRIQDKGQVSSLYSVLKSEVAKYDGVVVDSREYTDYPSSGGDGLHYSGNEGTKKAQTWANEVMDAIQGK